MDRASDVWMAALGGELRTETLENGLRVCLLDCPGTGLTSTTMCFRAGTLSEPPGLEGIAHFLEHMMFKGSPRFGPGEIDRLTLALGGSNNAFTSHDSSVYHFSFAADRWEQALSIEADRMERLALSADEIETERGVILEEIALQEQDPWDLLEQRVRETLYGRHPYGRPVLGRPESVARIGASDLGKFHSRRYGPENAVLVVAGEIGESPVERIRARFDEVGMRGSPESATSGRPSERGSGRVDLRRGDMARLLIAVPVPEATHPDHVPLRLLTAILGTGRSSRLYHSLVDELQLCVSVACDISETVEPGSMSLEAEIIPGVPPRDVEDRALAELLRLGREPVSQAELERSRAMVQADWLFAHEHILERAVMLGLSIALFDRGYPQRVLDELARCDVERLFEVGRRYLVSSSDAVVGWSLPEKG